MSCLLEVVLNSRPLQEEIAALPKPVLERLMKKCKVKSPEEIQWDIRCQEDRSFGRMFLPTTLKYRWQAEFRSSRLLQHEALRKYRYMFWLDADAFCSSHWQQDPVAFMIRNDLVLLFNALSDDRELGPKLHSRIRAAFDTDLCHISLNNGKLESRLAPSCENSLIKILGYMHLSNLDFYPSPTVQKFLKLLNEGEKYWRKYDDQIAMIIPAAILAPNKTWSMIPNGVELKMIHNGLTDQGKKASGYLEIFEKTAAQVFRGGHRRCKTLVKFDG